MHKILIAEDEPLISTSIREILDGLGEMKQVYDGEEALFEAESGVYDLLVLDVMMPEMDGFTVLQKMREQKIQTPVLVLTAKGEISNKVTGFEIGADDYLTKPFHREELRMRAQVLLKRGLGLENLKQIQVGDLTVELEKYTATYQGQSLELAGKEFDVFVYLLENQGIILTKEQIFNRIWEFDSDTSLTVVEVYVSKIRKLLKKVGMESWIRTVRGVGYMLEVPNEAEAR